MTIEESAPPGVDISHPSVARVYDHMLGGKDNFAVDRQAGEMALQITPDGPAAARVNRLFLRRVVRHLVEEAGIRQFLDLGSGLPTQGNVHEIAHQFDPTARVIYVDHDPMVLAHSQALLTDTETTAVVQADVREPAELLAHPEVRRFIDFDEPVGLLLMAILHHVGDDEDPAGIAATFRKSLASGSYLAISHFHNPGAEHPEAAAKAVEVERVFNQTMGTGRWRTRAEILSYFGDFTLLAPGVVPLAEWRPEGTIDSGQTDTYYTFVGGLARKP
ncbi:SAM-dependent methyltransferase [Natronosporangium hydrolyticum]|uniref:SAM-dependent methyltransferase n=1 Tax=Natronosporangium hydrolyticum TaxID=2811111 RepID=A0A895YBI3_9ACTN|nr:SAM-dependent methyltransferase [Natronosporangium hydrolyticum]QSB15164.1 SAM-dependent methyltransferase [Natronosporangium hydrolyticum]